MYSFHLGLDCSARLSKCGDRNCLPSEWWCDSEADCYHGEDEQSCGMLYVLLKIYINGSIEFPLNEL